MVFTGKICGGMWFVEVFLEVLWFWGKIPFLEVEEMQPSVGKRKPPRITRMPGESPGFRRHF